MAKAKAISNLKKVSGEKPTLSDLFVILSPHHDDRTAAIIGGARLESALEGRVLHFLRPLNNDRRKRLFEGGGPLASFSAKIQLGYALSVYDAAFMRELDRIKEIRNAFAHAQRPLRFKRRAVSDVCKSLRLPAMHPPKNKRPRTAREKFDFTVSLLVVALSDAQPLDDSWNRKEILLDKAWPQKSP